MICAKCESGSVLVVPAEIRLYHNCHRTLSHPPMTPSPDIMICLDCGWSEFSVPSTWLSAGWLRSVRSQNLSTSASIVAENVAVLAS